MLTATITAPDEFGIRKVEFIDAHGHKCAYCCAGVAIAWQIKSAVDRGDFTAAEKAQRRSRQLPHDDVAR